MARAQLCHLLLAPSIALAATGALAADADHPVVVELFQSQGCSSCPPANANLNAVTTRPDVLALSFAVTYWDWLGWKDKFAHPVFTERQWEYARAGRRKNVSTPQMIVNGRGILIGHSRNEVQSALERFDRGTSGPQIGAGDGHLRISAGTARRPANVWLVRYDPRVQNVSIRAGENGGRTLPHRNIVRHLELMGKWYGRPASFLLPTYQGPYRTAVLVQDGPGGAILAARKI